MEFINQSDIIGKVIEAGTTSITGHIIATLFIILLFLLIICTIFGIPLEFSLILIWPFLIAIAAFQGEFFILAIAILFLFAFIAIKTYFLK